MGIKRGKDIKRIKRGSGIRRERDRKRDINRIKKGMEIKGGMRLSNLIPLWL